MKMKFVDYAVMVLFVALVIIIYVFTDFHAPWYVYVVIAAIVIVFAIVKYKQYKKLKELSDVREAQELEQERKDKVAGRTRQKR